MEVTGFEVGRAPVRMGVRSILVPPLSESVRTARLSAVAEWKTFCKGEAPLALTAALGMSSADCARSVTFGSALLAPATGVG